MYFYAAILSVDLWWNVAVYAEGENPLLLGCKIKWQEALW